MTESRTIDNFQGNTFGFSGVNLDELDEIGVTQYSIFGLAFDRSGSTYSYTKEMERAANLILKAAKLNPRADNMMVRTVAFSDTVVEIPTKTPGFQLLHDLAPGDFDPRNADDLPKTFDNQLAPMGATALIDAGIDLAESIAAYGGKMVDENDYLVNGGLFILTDGLNNAGKYSATNGSDNKHLRDAIAKIMAEEKLESFQPFLIAVGVKEAHKRAALEQLASDCGFTPVPHPDPVQAKAGKTVPYIDVMDVSATGLAKFAQWVSESISSTSKALGSGGPSQPLSATF